MKEAPESDLRSFTTDDLDELLIGLGEMTGLNDEQVRMLLDTLPVITGSVCVRDVSSSAQEKKQGLFHCLQMEYGGKTYRIANRIEGGRYFVGEITSSAGNLHTSVKFEPVKTTGRNADESTSAIDDDWN